jgi:hypothetical protein
MNGVVSGTRRLPARRSDMVVSETTTSAGLRRRQTNVSTSHVLEGEDSAYSVKATFITAAIAPRYQQDLQQPRQVYLAQEQYQKALESNSKTLYIQIRVVGQDHPDVANTYYDLACLHASRDTEQCRMMLAKAEETGCLWQAVTIAHVQQDSDLDPVRHLDWFTDLLSRGKAQT